MNPMFRARKSASVSSLRAVRFSQQTSTVPPVGASMQPMRFRRVVLPLPDAPITIEKRLEGIDSVMPESAFTSVVPTRYVLLTVDRRTTLDEETCGIMLVPFQPLDQPAQ